MEIKQISSLVRVKRKSSLNYDEINNVKLLKGEKYSYQIAIKTDKLLFGSIEIESPLKNNVNVFIVENAVLDNPVRYEEGIDDDINYETKECGFMPDILVPIEDKNNMTSMSAGVGSFWVDVNISPDCPAGTYPITIKLMSINPDNTEPYFTKTLEVEVINEVVEPQSLIYTRWLYVDCIADYHCVEIYSEKHWELIENYISQAVSVGVNMILIPVHTPPLDTEIGTKRPCVQLVDIKKTKDGYTFDFDRFKKFIDICKKHGVKYYEIAHMFSQWGAKNAPNIMVTENGKTDYMFGWHTDATSEDYVSFLKQYITAISKALKEENIIENTYFHISDEPTLETIEAYQRASDIIKPLIGNGKTLDALSEYSFYEKGFVEVPVTIISSIEKFLKHDVKHQWVYYCCLPQKKYPNAFLSMPLSRIRILGVLMYKYNIEGFLHWGLNYYNAYNSHYNINPYQTTSVDGAYPSGDAFILYPSKNGAYNSIRGKATYEAICDMNLCRTLEKYISHKEIVNIIDSCANRNLTFSDYPVNKEFFSNLRDRLIDKLHEFI